MKKKIQKPFDIKAAQAGAIVETREGNSVRILCYDMNDSYPIVALTSYGDCEAVRTYPLNGKYNGMPDYSEDLVIVEEIEEPERWADNKYFRGEGYALSLDHVNHYEDLRLNIGFNCSLFATEKQAKSAIAMARISQLMKHDVRYGGVVTDEEWMNVRPKYVIERREGAIFMNYRLCNYSFLAFHKAEQRDLFLAENERLVKVFLMIE
ncbi:MAG: hypothetical protein K6G73_12240 [Marinilabiliaceae bacterium]|nr:hypothetical protein [Marinilabiliaceae bacterium]